MKSDFPNASKATRKRNPEFFTPLTPRAPAWKFHGIVAAEEGKPARRLRQDSTPLNKLESAWLEVLKERYPNDLIHAQAMRLKLAAGAWFKPDLCVFASVGGCKPRWIAYETKCFKGKNSARGILALKCAAHQFPEICFVLVWKDADGQWKEQIVKA